MTTVFRRGRAVLAILSALILAVFLASPAPASSARTWTVKVGQESRNGAIQGMAFGPGEIWINVGDKVHWVAGSMEIHTVSFPDATHPAVPFGSPGSDYMTVPTPETTIDHPGQYRNSGLMATMSDPSGPPLPTSYDLTFNGIGDYDYICYVHGEAMSGIVHVRASGTPYPYSQHHYTAQANKIRAHVLADGHSLRSRARHKANAHHVFVGAADMTALVMRFVRSKVTIRTGQSVMFDMGRNAFPVPHTVTFGPEPANEAPVGDPTHYSGGQLSSGILLAQPFAAGAGVPSTFTVTFTKAGTYHYICMLHDGMGMKGTVVVH